MRAYMTALPDRGAAFGAALAHVVKAAKLNPKVGLATIDTMVWPLPNVWLGVSAENQTAWNARVPDLQATPAAVRWISAEPLLGSITGVDLRNLDWVVVGGESDRLGRARPMHPRWARDLRDACVNAEVDYFFKQWGDWGPVGDAMPGACAVNMAGAVRIMDSAPINGEAAMRRDGKVLTGRFLDGRTCDDMPEVTK